MKSVFLALTLLSTLATAETATITVEGMHCSGCKAMIKESVCDDAALKPGFESCSVKMIDGKKETGQISIVTKKDVELDLAAVKAGVKKAGDEYKVTKEEVK